jgi:RNA-binding protein 5/10
LGACYESIKIPRDRTTGEIRGFAFVKFISTEHALQFFESFGNYVTIGHEQVRMEFAFQQSEEDWNCASVTYFFNGIVWF